MASSMSSASATARASARSSRASASRARCRSTSASAARKRASFALAAATSAAGAAAVAAPLPAGGVLTAREGMSAEAPRRWKPGAAAGPANESVICQWNQQILLFNRRLTADTLLAARR